MKIYTLRSGKKISLSTANRPREGEVVFFRKDEWDYIRQMGFTHDHKDFLWNQKYRDFRYPIIPEKGLTAPETVIKVCEDVKRLISGGKK